MLRGTKGLSPENAAGAVFWRSLAQLLMLDFIPVFQPKLSEADKHLLSDWMDAGGTIATFMDDPDRHQHFYQAQLVCLLQEQARLKDRSRAWLFRWFANEVDTNGPKEKQRRISLLPRAYRERFDLKINKTSIRRHPAIRAKEIPTNTCPSWTAISHRRPLHSCFKACFESRLETGSGIVARSCYPFRVAEWFDWITNSSAWSLPSLAGN